MNPTVKTILIWVLILFIAVGLYNFFQRPASAPRISYTDFLNAVDRGEVAEVTIAGSTVKGRLQAANPVFEATIPDGQVAIYEKLVAKNVRVTVDATDRQQSGLTLFASWVFSMLAAFGLGWLGARWSLRQGTVSTMAI